jgi:RNA binding exosome subunit
MSEQRFEDDGIEYNNNYNYALLDTYYEFDGKRIIEWNKHSDNVEYTDFERITEILNIKQMRLESLMKHREEIGKLFDRIDEQQATIEQLQDLCGKSDGENAKLRIENEQLKNKLNKTL